MENARTDTYLITGGCGYFGDREAHRIPSTSPHSSRANESAVRSGVYRRLPVAPRARTFATTGVGGVRDYPAPLNFQNSVGERSADGKPTRANSSARRAIDCKDLST
ncbi:hypothetical protein F2P81_004823 [Scophthalmus maximus]|uniref:Uncharacterized protein n=1 Tax=Scophthalmus maximus TaxID=52904 RepID=A0A6A4T7G7_SCOMX|nr:hypothetical protein F2P81_004823 [Scophthalmus maximus]